MTKSLPLLHGQSIIIIDSCRVSNRHEHKRDAINPSGGGGAVHNTHFRSPTCRIRRERPDTGARAPCTVRKRAPSGQRRTAPTWPTPLRPAFVAYLWGGWNNALIRVRCRHLRGHISEYNVLYWKMNFRGKLVLIQICSSMCRI